jgi:hypothetical protein
MKIKELIALLQTRDEESTVYVATKEGYEQLGRVMEGKYFNTIALATKVVLSVDQAETMLYQLASYDNLTEQNREDISRVLGAERVETILSEIKHYQDEMRKVRTEIDTSVEFGEIEEDDDEEDDITQIDIDNH